MLVPGSDAASIFYREQLARIIKQELITHSIEKLRIADIGCGFGYWLQIFSRWGGRPGNVVGVDLDSNRLRTAKAGGLIQGDARRLPLRDKSFDLVTQFTLFTSILGDCDRASIASEMRRILKPGGLIFWYDFFAPNVLNKRTRRVSRGQLTRLFPKCVITFRKVTLAPPIARISLRISRKLTVALDKLSGIHTHYFAVIRP